MRLTSVWTKHLQDPDSIESFEETIIASRTIRDRLSVILQEKIDNLDKSENYDEFDSPAWAYQQAYRNGRRSVLKEIITLLTIRNKHDPV
jgi:hypothetical protein